MKNMVLICTAIALVFLLAYRVSASDGYLAPQGHSTTDVNISYVDIYGRIHKLKGGYFPSQPSQDTVINGLTPISDHLLSIPQVFDMFYMPDTDSIWILYYLHGNCTTIIILPTKLLGVMQ